MTLVAAPRLAIVLAGICAFLNLYATQPLLPLFAAEFGASEAAVSLTVSATTIAVALVAPFVGIAADMLGRKRIILGAVLLLVVPTVLLGLSHSLASLVFWRFVQGLLLPPVFTVAVAYIGDEWPQSEVPGITGLYIAGSALGGFLGRFLAGLAAEYWDWRSAFLVLALVNLASGAAILATLPRERHFVRAADLASSLRMMARHLHDRRILGTCLIGFSVLFSFVALFTYVNFHLAAPPFRLSSSALGSIFLVYLLGIMVTPLTGRWTRALGRRRLILVTVAVWLASLGLALAPSLPLVVLALALTAACGFLSQASATGFLAAETKEGRSSAVGVYVTCYYLGGSTGAVLPGLFWQAGGWPSCVAVVALAVLLIGTVAARAWR